jgi:hypothetical protein
MSGASSKSGKLKDDDLAAKTGLHFFHHAIQSRSTFFSAGNAMIREDFKVCVIADR